MKKGLSFTLTLVVVGVILLMTALSVITLGGSSIGNFFNTVNEQAADAEIRQACNDLASDIQTSYCSQYVKTEVYEDADGTLSGSSDYQNETGDQWVAASASCDAAQSERVPRSYQAAQADGAFTETASEAGCSWRNYQPSAIVTVNGQDYNCIDEGYINDDSCPAQ